MIAGSSTTVPTPFTGAASVDTSVGHTHDLQTLVATHGEPVN